MTPRADTPRLARVVAFWLIAGVGCSVLALAWFGFRATREWRRSSLMLVQSRAEETADVLVRTLARDMRGVDEAILSSVHWDELPLDTPHEIGDRVASAFARYPYPEAFFGWDGVSPDRNLVFFTRADRRPRWLSIPPPPGAFPVSIVRDPPNISHLTQRFAALAAQGRRFVAFETTLGGRPYQIVARLLYRDPRRTQLERVFGFIVDLEWVRASYFPELTDEVSRLTGANAGLRIAILDDRGRMVAGTPAASRSDSAVIARPLRPLFFDHELVLLNPASDLPMEPWRVEVDPGSDPAMAAAVRGADWTLGVTASAAVVLTMGLLLAGRALRASGELTRLRADFVSSVTHELKTPLATIRGAAETLARGRVTDQAGVSDYARLLDQEAQRLGAAGRQSAGLFADHRCQRGLHVRAAGGRRADRRPAAALSGAVPLSARRGLGRHPAGHRGRARRSHGAAAGVRQPDRQRRALFARSPRAADRGLGGRTARAHRRARPRHRHSRGRDRSRPAALRAGPARAVERQRPRPGDRAAGSSATTPASSRSKASPAKARRCASACRGSRNDEEAPVAGRG